MIPVPITYAREIFSRNTTLTILTITILIFHFQLFFTITNNTIFTLKIQFKTRYIPNYITSLTNVNYVRRISNLINISDKWENKEFEVKLNI